MMGSFRLQRKGAETINKSDAVPIAKVKRKTTNFCHFVFTLDLDLQRSRRVVVLTEVAPSDVFRRVRVCMYVQCVCMYSTVLYTIMYLRLNT